MTKSKLEALKEKRDQINSQIQSLKAREQAQQRKDETRRKVLVGSVVMKLVKEGKITASYFNQWMDEGLTKEKDRELLGLAPLAKALSHKEKD